jgi:hypothetical protein
VVAFIEAARQVCGRADGNLTALRLLALAVDELKTAMGPAGLCISTTRPEKNDFMKIFYLFNRRWG